jgi:hypothetical protein
VRRALRDPAYYTPGNEAQLQQLNHQYVQCQVEEGRNQTAAGDARRASLREEGARSDARSRLQAARDEVNRLRTERDEAVDTALTTLKDARHHAVHESFWGKIEEWAEKTFSARALAALTHFIDAAGSYLQDAALVLAVIGMVFPPAEVLAGILIATSTVLTVTAAAICLVRVANARTPVERDRAMHDLEHEGISLVENKIPGGVSKLAKTKFVSQAIRDVGATPLARDLSKGTLKLVRAPVPTLLSSGFGRRVLEVGEPILPSKMLTRVERATVNSTHWPTIGDDLVKFPFLGTKEVPTVPERIGTIWKAGGNIVQDRVADHVANGVDDLRHRCGVGPEAISAQSSSL